MKPCLKEFSYLEEQPVKIKRAAKATQNTYE